MDSKNALSEFQKILEKNTVYQNFCARELQWIENRRRTWTADKLRVGVIGVTSSGKSTLINAILGADILSSAVDPSSSQLVCCSYGKEKQIKIFFKEKPPLCFSGKDYTQEKLKRYSDEHYNSQNKEGVRSIELTSPLFDLGEDVLLVDSPGLDAYQLKAHETLTLESLVPTIDVCIYVTTMKSNSDQKTLEFLDVVAKYKCPVILVQNMLDSVRPSVSNDKSAAQVAQEHRCRLKRILERSSVSKDSACIIQMSAKYAQLWRCAAGNHSRRKVAQKEYEKSNYQLFVRNTKRILAEQKPRIEKQRIRSLIECAVNLRSSIQEKIDANQSTAAGTEDVFPLQALEDLVVNRSERVQTSCSKIFEDFAEASHRIRVAIGKDEKDGLTLQDCPDTFQAVFAGCSKWPKLETCLTLTNKLVEAFEQKLSQMIAEQNEFVQKAAEELHIPARDLLHSGTLKTFRDISVSQTMRSELVPEEKPGFFNAVARGFGSLVGNVDWGYEWKKEQTPEIDINATKRKIFQRLAQAYQRYERHMENWLEGSFKHSQSLIEEELNAAKKSYEEKRQIQIETEALQDLDQDIENLIEKLDAKELRSYNKKVQAEEKNVMPETRKVEVSEEMSAVLRLARAGIQQQFRKTIQTLIRQIGYEDAIPVVLSWDSQSTNWFLWQSGLCDARIVQAPTSETELPAGEKRCFFILFNLTQYGSARNQVANLHLDAVLTKQDYIIWVVQDFGELLNADNVVEGLTRMMELSESFSAVCDSKIYLLHENPVYSIGFLQYQFELTLQQEPHALISALQEKFHLYVQSGASLNVFGEIVRKVSMKPDNRRKNHGI